MIYVNFFLEQHFNDVYDSETLEQKMDADLQVWEDTWNHNMNVKLQQVRMGYLIYHYIRYLLNEDHEAVIDIIIHRLAPCL